MSDAAYDHAEKCGNEGDVVKHVALLAALDVLLSDWPHGRFRYADTFAGYAATLLCPGGEWERGAGRLAGMEALDENPHAGLWRRWYLPRPHLAGAAYPGSSLIAGDVAARHGVPFVPALWDVSPAAVSDLRRVWGRSASIHDRPANAADAALESADFVFVDPPAVWLETGIRAYLAPLRRGGSLVWLPLLRGEAIDATLPEHSAVDVRWPGVGKTVGCRLLHRLPASAADALRAAVRRICRVAGWDLQDA